MSFEIPYERLGVKNIVDYIPLKLALNDTDESKNYSASNSAAGAKNDNDNLFYNNITSGRGNEQRGSEHIILITLLSIFCIIVILYIVYAIYFFIILRDEQKSIAPQPVSF
ncbi:hypothetical protein [Ectropis obliqua nucleopolyhedrovirus]|uniref:Putative 12.5 kDa protein n=1 Tax=Ectropis obliqua nucleopolyhedrovirus TaxID=59376 RepID=A0EYW5_9ABAC|nr:hypothetical protein EONV_gp062 [Ectropis obliqua nucleopolyhedrovirus]ABI35745.1 hypothetical protein [Ectropis obliqua nucleopolyhedrovirus]AGS47917.1 putative 12.5 kDa protein [Ectropis obliqua nucleopolyhedrovirus]QWV59669.1 hypothetical protein EONV_gp062 [Ectropis obliqua nucleopolyhedrovirus]UYO72860.1 hypothetical protein EONV-gp062 [Ectropis obliqua nucleopolyhedrovirus]